MLKDTSHVKESPGTKQWIIMLKITPVDSKTI